jgi:hypothetical protein
MVISTEGYDEMRNFEVELAVSDRRSGRFIGLFLVEVTAYTENEAIDHALFKADSSFLPSLEASCNGLKEV